MERAFEIGGKKFQLNKINAIEQFHIVRRMGPILADLFPAMKELKVDGVMSESQKLDQFAKILSPVMMGLSKLSDKDADLVLFGLLGAVEFQQSVGWARVASGGMLMIQDLELPVLLQLAGRAFAFNLAGFFAGLPRPT